MSMALKAVFERDLALAYRQRSELMQPMMSVSYTHLTLPTNREV